MADGYINSSSIVDKLINEFSIAGIITKTLAVLVIVFLFLSFSYPDLLGITGSFVVATVAMFSYDLHKKEQAIVDDVEKAETINEFQIALISIIHELSGVRANYEDRFDTEKGEHQKHDRFLKVPYIVVIPKITITELKRNLAKLSFTAKLISKKQADGIFDKDISIRARSLTVLSFHLSTVESLTEMWIVRNRLHQECYVFPADNDAEAVKPDLSNVPAVQRFANYAAITDQCMKLTDLVLEHTEAALKYFIPAAAELLNEEARKRCPIPSMSGKVVENQFSFRDLEGEEALKLRYMASQIAGNSGLYD